MLPKLDVITARGIVVFRGALCCVECLDVGAQIGNRAKRNGVKLFLKGILVHVLAHSSRFCG